MPDVATMTVGPRVPREFRSVTHTAQLIHQTRSKLRTTRSSSPLRALQLSNLLTDLQTHLRYCASAAPPPSYEEALRERRRERYDLPEHYLRQDFLESDYAVDDDEDDDEEEGDDDMDQPTSRDAIEEWQEDQCQSTTGKIDDLLADEFAPEDDDDMSLTRVWSRTNDTPTGAKAADEETEDEDDDDDDMPSLTRQSSHCETSFDNSSDEDFESHDDAEGEEDVEHHDSQGESELVSCKSAILEYLRSTKVVGMSAKQSEPLLAPMTLKFQARSVVQPVACAAG